MFELEHVLVGLGGEGLVDRIRVLLSRRGSRGLVGLGGTHLSPSSPLLFSSLIFFSLFLFSFFSLSLCGCVWVCVVCV